MKVIFDIDGTLANIEHRLHMIRGSNMNWDGFFAACVDDEPILEVIHVLHALSHCGHEIEFWTGRSDQVREETLDWLLEYALSSVRDEVVLKMRKEGDHRPAHVIKMEFIDPDSPPDIVFDDRSHEVEAYRAQGIRVCQVAEGAF